MAIVEIDIRFATVQASQTDPKKIPSLLPLFAVQLIREATEHCRLILLTKPLCF